MLYLTSKQKEKTPRGQWGSMTHEPHRKLINFTKSKRQINSQQHIPAWGAKEEPEKNNITLVEEMFCRVCNQCLRNELSFNTFICSPSCRPPLFAGEAALIALFMKEHANTRLTQYTCKPLFELEELAAFWQIIAD